MLELFIERGSFPFYAKGVFDLPRKFVGAESRN